MKTKKIIQPIRKRKEPTGRSIVSEPGEVRRLLARAISSGSSVTVQLADGKHRFPSRLSEAVRVSEGFHLERPSGLGPEEFLAAVAKGSEQGSRRACIIMVFLTGQVLLGIAEPYRKCDASGLYFGFPERLVKIQRRNDERFTIPAGYEMYGEWNDSTPPKALIRKRILDIGGGGLAFRVDSAQEAEQFPKGKVIRELRFSLLGQVIIVDAEVCNPSDHKIGIKFTRIAPKDVDFIAGYVATQTAYLAI